ncbi:MAG: alpha/beta fold hydrolase [Bacteroidota bacterium]
MKSILKTLQLCLLLSFVLSCTKEEMPTQEAAPLEEQPFVEQQKLGGKEPVLSLSSNVQITNHFENWLNNNGYGSFDFAGDPGESFGGKTSNSTPVTKHPVIFIHGNGDKATSWEDSYDYFISQGYTNAELYAMTWGPANPLLASSQYHSQAYLSRVRSFIQAVKAYTGATEVDVIGHSMGVTLGRKAIQGGTAYDAAVGGNYNLGSSLNYIDAFVGIAGANRGLVSCYYAPGTATCDDRNGFYPGYLFWGSGPFGVSDLLDDLNSNPGVEADYVYSIWSSSDQIVGYGCYVYGQITCRIPGQDGEKKFSTYGHFGVRDLSGYNQLRMVRDHATN